MAIPSGLSNSGLVVSDQFIPVSPLTTTTDDFLRKFSGLEGIQSDEVHDEQWISVYTWVLHFSSILSTGLAALTFHTIFHKSTPSMAMYRLYLLNCLCWGYLYSVVLGQIQPVFLAPLVAGYLRSPTLPRLFDSATADIQLMILSELCFLNYVLGLLLLLLYRFVFFSSSDSGLLARAMGSPWLLFFLMMSNTLINLTIINLVVDYLRGDQDQFLSTLDEAFPQLSSLFTSHRLIGYNRLGDFKILSSVAEACCISTIAVLALANWLIHRKKPKTFHGTNTAKTSRMMNQLYRMNTVQIALIAIILLCPMVVGVSLTAHRIRSVAHRFWLIALAVSSFHCCLDSLVILLYIRPYRDHLYSLVPRLRLLPATSKWRRLWLLPRRGSPSGNSPPTFPLAIMSRPLPPPAMVVADRAIVMLAPRLSIVVAQARQHLQAKKGSDNFNHQPSNTSPKAQPLSGPNE